MTYLSVEDLLVLAGDLGVGPLRDLGLLESASHRPSASLWGTEAYPSLELKAAALLDSLVNSHPLVDGNERLGWLATAVFMDFNGKPIDAPDDEAYELVISLAAGRVALDDVERALEAWVRSSR